MPSCVVKSCKNYISKFKKSNGITYHAFPRNKYRKDEWVLIVRNCRGDDNWDPSSASTVCSAHFDDGDFIATAKGLRCLVPNAIPKRLLSNLPETQTTQITSSPILQKSLDVKEDANSQQSPSSPSTISSLLQVPVLTDEFALTGYCRLCAASNYDGKLVNIQSDNDLKKLVVNMSRRLNINIDFSQEHLPTTICSVCVKSLYTAYDFVVGIDLAQVTLNKISMQKYKYQMPENLNLGNNMDLSSTSLEQTNNRSEANNFEQPTLHVPNTIVLKSEVSSNIEVAANYFDQPLLQVSSTITPLQQLSPNTKVATSNFEKPPLLELASTIPFLRDTFRKQRLKDEEKKVQIIDLQKKNLKRLNQKVRRLRNRNETLKNILKNLKQRTHISTDLYITNE